ncbi:MAG: hypothetical protein ACYTBJ_01285 [Planctomycetota bacterium]|jgi:ribosomal protein L32
MKWSKQDEWILRTTWHEKPTRQIAKDLGRTYHGVRAKARCLGLSKKACRGWTPYEDLILKRKYEQEKAPARDVCFLLGKTPHSVHGRRDKLGISAHRKCRRWTVKEEDYLRANWLKLPEKRIAKKLRRSLAAVRIRARKLQVSERFKHTSIRKVALMLGYDRKTVMILIKRFKLPIYESEHGQTRIPKKTLAKLQAQVKAMGYPLQPIRKLNNSFVCARCGESRRPHHAKGLCHSCYYLERKELNEKKKVDKGRDLVPSGQLA